MTELEKTAAISSTTPTTDDSERQVEKARNQIEKWLNKPMRVAITDGRVLVGVLLCTDRDRNLILGSCNEYIGTPSEQEEFRVLGLALVPGHHIQSIHIDENSSTDRQSTKLSNYKNVDQLIIDDDKSDG